MTNITQPIADQTYPRTHYEAVLDIKHAVLVHRLNERLYNRADALMGAIGMAGGSGAVVGLLGSSPKVAAVAGAVLAVLAIVERTVGAARKAEVHRQGAEAFAAIEVRAAGLQLAELDAELAATKARFPDGLEALGWVAYNRNVRSAGHISNVVPMTRWQRLLNACV